MKLKILFLATISTIALSACSSKAPQNETIAPTTTAVTTEATTTAISEEKPAEEQVQTSSEKPKESSSEVMDFNTIVGLLGKEDTSIVSALGEGTPMFNDEKILMERTYTLPLLGEDANVTMTFNLYNYGDNILESSTINLSKGDLDGYKDMLVKLVGEPSESGEKYYTFATDKTTITLANPYDATAYIEIALNTAE